MLGVAMHSADRTTPRHSVRTCKIIPLFQISLLHIYGKYPDQLAPAFPQDKGKTHLQSSSQVHRKSSDRCNPCRKMMVRNAPEHL